MRTKRWAGVMIGLAVALGATEALACGGCFGPPPPTPRDVQVVTDHRMVLALSASQTTLWDQFAYSGRPSEFSWILPIRYTERLQVAIADDGFLSYVNNVTAPRLIQPPFPWGPCPMSPSAGGFFDASSASDAGAPNDRGVTVLRMETVGPYSVSIIRGTDPMAMRDWLRSNGYTVPSAVEPIIDHYTAMNMDYIALRLRPGEGINRMSPVRVTLDGAQPVLPLRMIAAGIADRVGLSLVVISSSRYEAQNFPNGEIREADLTWDFARPGSPASDFLSAFNALNRANGDRLWLTESATRQSRAGWESAAPSYRNPVSPGGPGRPPFGFDAGTPDAGDDVADADDAGPATDPLDDVRVAFTGLGDDATVTRFRANMLGTMLTQDLQLRASDLGLRERNYNYGRLLNDPGPTCGGTTDPVDAGTPDGGVETAGSVSEGGVRCAASPGRKVGGESTLAALVGLALAAVGLRARRRR